MGAAREYTADRPPPGIWIRFADHFPHSLTPEYQRLYTSTFESAQQAMYERYGVPFKGIAVAIIEGHIYIGPVPLVGGMGATAPPKPLLWLATRLHPAFRRRRERARQVLRDRPWLDEVHVWRRELRRLWMQGNLALQATDPNSLDDEELGHHLQRCRANAEEGYRVHFMLHGPDLFATGLLLARGEEWGLATHELLGALVGYSPASTGSDEDLDRLRSCVAASGASPATLEALRALGPEVDEALDRFLLNHGWRLTTSYDLDGSCLNELPSLVVALATTPQSPQNYEDNSAVLRHRVPTEQRGEFDRLLADARFTYGLRDDNGGLTGAWPVGLLRRGMLEAGRRLQSRDRLTEVAHVVEVDVDELLVLLGGEAGVSAGEIAERAVRRAETSRRRPPAQFGPSLPGPKVIACFPEPLGLMIRAQLALADGSYHGAMQPLAGLGVGEHCVTGRALVAEDAADALARMSPGAILVTRSTTPAFNGALSIAGGLVVEEGGYLSHAAVTARELGLTAIIGASGAVAALPDGAMVELDPHLGLARLLDGVSAL